MNQESKGEVVIYRQKSGRNIIEVKLDNDTVWLTQKQISELFATERSVITKHINNVFSTRELEKESVCAKFAHTAADGKIYQTNYYNLDLIISVGYRVNSKRGTQFRIWATQVLKDHIIKGYSINEKRLKEQNERLIELQKTVNLMGSLYGFWMQTVFFMQKTGKSVSEIMPSWRLHL